MTEKRRDIFDYAYETAVRTLFKCVTDRGMYASGGKKGYKGVWSRDSIITFLGASLVKKEKKRLKECFKKSLITLGENQSEKGQIPNAVHGFEQNQKIVDYGSIDSSLWFIIGHYIYKKRYRDNSLFKKYKKNIKNAFNWLTYQDVGEDLMLEQLPTSDWQDAFPHRYGKTINTQALYYKVLNLVGERKKAKKLKFNVNLAPEIKLWGISFYYAYRWKNHNKYKEIGDWFDSFGNLLAVLFDLAEKKQAEKILLYILRNRVNKPYPVRTIHPPITKRSDYWRDYYLDCDAKNPHHYLNGGIWPFIGGFYILALIKLKKFKQAKKELKILAESNVKGNVFPEWINPIDRRTHGFFQAWSAGTYILAYESLKKKKVLL